MIFKICFVTHEYPPDIGGVGFSVQRLARILAGLNCEVHVAVFKETNRAILLDENVTTYLDEKVHVHRIQISSYNMQEIGILYPRAKQIREMVFSLRTLTERHGYDVLTGFYLFPGGFVATVVGSLTSVKTVVSIRGSDVGENMFDPVHHSFIEYTLKNADYVVSCATELLKIADTIYPINKKSRTILNSIDLKKISLQKANVLKLKKPVIGALGVFKYKKGLAYLLKALTRLKREKNFTLMLIGGFKEEEERKIHLRYLEDSNLSDCTIVTGLLPKDEIYSYLSKIDIFVIPSLFSEGCPNALLDAMAMKLPIIAARSGAMPEVLQDGHSAILVEPGNTQQLYAGILRLLEDEKLAARLSVNAYNAINKLTPEYEGGAWIDVYKKIISKKYR